MKHHEDQFFESVRNELYAMEVTPPAAIQAKVMARVRPGRAPWLLNSVAALLVCAAGAGIAGWHYINASCTAEQSFLAKPKLDAALTTAQSRIVERENLLAEPDEEAQTVVALHSTPQARKSAQPTGQLSQLAAAVEVPMDNGTPECDLPKLPEPTADSAPKTDLNVANGVAAPSLSAAEILKHANDSSDEVIRMSVKLTVPVDDKD